MVRAYESYFFVTINFNKNINKYDDGYKKYINKLKKFVNEIFNDENTHNILMDDSNLKNIQFFKTIEQSKIKKHPHIHMLILIKNNGKKAKLNFEYIREQGRKWNNEKNIHMKNKIINKNDIKNVMEYMKKGEAKSVYQFLNGK